MMGAGDNHQKFIIATLVVVLGAMGVGFASYSQKLNINGTTTVASNKWSVHFVQAGAKDITTGGTERRQLVIDEARNTVSFDIGMRRPGDAYNLRIPIVNDGTFDAALTSIEVSQLDAKQREYVHIGVQLEAISPERSSVSTKTTLYGSNVNEGISDFAPIPFLAGDKTEDKYILIKTSYVAPADPSMLPSRNEPISITIKLNINQS